MKSFRASFQIVEDNNCPLYELDDLFVLTEKSVFFPDGKESCLILIRELTQLLFQLLGMSGEPDFIKKYTCSGCTGLIKFRQIHDDADTNSDVGESLLSEKEQRLFDRIYQYPLLKVIPANRLKNFIGCFKGKVLREGELLITKGQPNRYLYIILSGEVAVEDGRVPLTKLGEGELCGEMSYFSDSIATSSVRGLCETRVLAIHGEDFSKLIKKTDSIQLYMAKLLAERLSHSNAVRASDFEACMQGRINEMAPAELMQVFHMHQKSGVLNLELPHGAGKVVFCEGAIVEGGYGGRSGQDAIYAILREREGVYNFTAKIDDTYRTKTPIGDFMALLMEGVKQVDEE